jgi:hypothetical protein
MAYSITDIFPNASVSLGELTLASGDIVSYVPVTTGNPSIGELVFGLCESLNQSPVATGLQNVRVSASNTNLAGGNIRRTYTIRVDLGVGPDVYDILNVLPEPS